MKFVEKYLTDKYINILFLVVLIIIASYLRFPNLGYSEFQDDEKKALIRKSEDESTVDFLLNQRKGPLQFLVTSSVVQITHNTRAEVWLRLPFTIASLLASVVFYLLVKQISKSNIAAFLGSLLFTTNGFIVGFSRIAQYQNLNLLFSLLAILMFSKLPTKENGGLKISVFGTIFFSLSLLAHWDAIFYIIPILYFVIQYLLKHKDTKQVKIKLVIINILTGCIMLLPFLVPYIYTQSKHQSNQEYFGKRVGVNTALQDKIANHKQTFDLYNPYITIYVLAIGIILSATSPKKNWLYILWAIINFLVILYFMRKPGTHIYNYVVPIIFLSSLGIKNLLKYKKIAFLSIPIVCIAIGILYYQSYIIFIDHSSEYPWDYKEIFKINDHVYANKEYRNSEIITFGFPHNRNWKEINRVTLKEGSNCSYITNEGKEISQIYMDLNYGKSDDLPCYFVIQVKRPFITRGADASFAEARDKYLVYKYVKDDETLAKVYKIQNKKYIQK